MNILVGMSGGMDSSVAAVMLKKQGFDVTGIHLIFWSEEGRSNKCCNTADLMWARKVADTYEFPFYTFDYRESFKNKVVDAYLSEDHSRVTPNPCVSCNRRVKFGQLIDMAEEMGMDKLATGHYARIAEEKGCFFLHRGVDEHKDQSYFLHRIERGKLAKTLFPLGDVTKDEVKAMAEAWGLVNPRRVKKESQDLCFIPDKTPEDFLRRNYSVKDVQTGDMVEKSGKVLGKHKGLPFYTLGQRKGLDIGGLQSPLYVIEKDAEKNRLVVGERANLGAKRFWVKDLNLLAEIDENMTYEVRIRYRGRGVLGSIRRGSGDTAEILLDEAAEAITPGQSAVLYDGSRCLGGGEITDVVRGD